MTTERSGMSLDDKVAEFVGAVACNGSLSSWAVDGICELIRSHLSRDAVVSDEDVLHALGKFFPGDPKSTHPDWFPKMRAALESLSSRNAATSNAISIMQRALEEGKSGGAAIWREGLETAIATLNGACAKCLGNGYYYGGDGHAYRIKCTCRKAMLAQRDGG